MPFWAGDMIKSNPWKDTNGAVIFGLKGFRGRASYENAVRQASHGSEVDVLNGMHVLDKVDECSSGFEQRGTGDAMSWRLPRARQGSSQ
jgi:hypothetical protein